MKRQYNVELIKFNELNTNERMYTKDSFKSIPNSVPIYSDKFSSMNSIIKNIVGTAENIRIENNMLMCDVSTNKDILGYYTTTSLGEIEYIDNINKTKNVSLNSVYLTLNTAYKNINNKVNLINDYESIRNALTKLPTIDCVVKFKPSDVQKFIDCKYYSWSMLRNDYIIKQGTFYYNNGKFHVTDLANYDSTDWIVDFFDNGKWKVGIEE